ncbi:DUF87 domain-containing protein [Candidatus Kaiserbacteria bacterium]|nr:DUF87 domain-containing protein [Candidatus Kaiserbacteria bacterium]MCB9811961.1 DUF87 domain-containing protein [Candidatus Nomurabacteria bacterium]
MEKAPERQFASPEEEIAFLREQIAAKERALLDRNPEMDQADIETIGRQELKEYVSFTPETVLAKERRLSEAEVQAAATTIEVATDKTEEIITLALEEGIYNALKVLEKLDDAYVTDNVHRQLIESIKAGKQMQDLREGVPPWEILHMTLFEVALPEHADEDRERTVEQLTALMEQFYAGMQSVGRGSGKEHMAIEIAVADKSDDIIFYVAVPNNYIDLFEKQLFSLYPNANLTEQKHDYNIFVDGGVSLTSVVKLKRHPIYPLRSAESFSADPLDIILNAFSKIEFEGGGAALQIMVRSGKHNYVHSYQEVLKRVRDGMKASEAIRRSSLMGEVFESTKELFFNKDKSKNESHYGSETIDSDATEAFQQKVAHPILETNIRIAVSAKDKVRAEQILFEVEAALNQFENTSGNRFTFMHPSGSALRSDIKAFSFREFRPTQLLPLSLEEVSLLSHFTGNGVSSSPQFRQLRSRTAPATGTFPNEGTLLGTNDHRGSEKQIFISEADRQRHFYIIGQTGTGKSVFMKNMIIQDIESGAGVCMIDPHGTDIEDVLAAVPKEREQDVIYFDPSRTDRVIGLNMLEYDRAHPEQKTFVVNELFSIFQRLYGANPESMGPMFEQYFRNATLLVMEDPDSGNTLMDISRVMSDARYRRHKLERAINPVVVQFWQEIATKAGGEASLENIVPYIVSKFDVFTANDYMRPIIGQQHSAFNFRKVMDERKILLVNLSKGRLGEINANLIGMIVVGKLLMAALSRVDDPSKSFAPFYLHIDEFQNVTTDSISAILSEARKYKLALTVAHQYIAQLEDGIRDSVFGNVGSLAAFRVGSEDATFLEKQFEPVFEASDLMNIPNYHAYMRVLAGGVPTKPFSVLTPPPREVDTGRVHGLIEQSYLRYGRAREEIEAEIAARYRKADV